MDKKEKTLHLLTTTLCERNCIYCCNKQMNINDIPYVQKEDILQCDTICITGGEPILYSNCCEISRCYKSRFKNIKNVYVYANATELFMYVSNGGSFDYLDGLSISVKSPIDVIAFREIVKRFKDDVDLKSNRVYVFDNLLSKNKIPNKWEYIERHWQEDFKPAENCIFRKV